MLNIVVWSSLVGTLKSPSSTIFPILALYNGRYGGPSLTSNEIRCLGTFAPFSHYLEVLLSCPFFDGIFLGSSIGLAHLNVC